MSRLVLFHYHLFKNAGTSVDKILQQNFGDGWLTREFEDRPAETHAGDVLDWVQSNPEACAFSSHTAQFLPPGLRGELRLFPIVFVRHPLDRIASAYSFERKQLGDTGFGAMLAQNTTLAGYVRARLAIPNDRQCRNFHIERFARMFAPEHGSERSRALAALEALPFVGVVEEFDASMAYLKLLVEPVFPDFQPFPVVANRSRETSSPLADRLDALRAELGDSLYEQLQACNADDLALYHAAQSLMMVF